MEKDDVYHRLSRKPDKVVVIDKQENYDVLAVMCSSM